MRVQQVGQTSTGRDDRPPGVGHSDDGPSRVGDADYARLLELRTALRRFLRWSDECAHAAGLTSPQHQLLLTVRGHDDHRGPTIGDVAGYLLLRHHSVVGLVDRAVAAGLLTRNADPGNHRAVRLRLTPSGEEKLSALAALHLDELRQLTVAIEALGGPAAADQRFVVDRAR
jgi:DNA-binding MarR family transcriptional regulator